MLRGNDEVSPAFASVTVGADGSVTAVDSYFYLPGRPGGQVANFSSQSGGGGTLRANPVNPADSIITVNSRVTIGLGAQTTSSSPLIITHAGATLGAPIIITYVMPSTVSASITLIRMQGAVTKTTGGVPFVLFNIAPVFNLQTNNSAGQVFFYAPNIGDDGQVRTVGLNTRIIIAQPNFRALTAGSTGTAPTITIAEITPQVDASWNAILLARFIAFSNPTGTHATGITDLIGIDVPAGVNKPANVWTVRNLEPAAKMLHVGPAAFGALATTAPAAGIALEVRSTTEAFVAPRMSGVQAAALVGVVPDGAQVYVNVANGGFVAVGMYQMTGGAWVAM